MVKKSEETTYREGVEKNFTNTNDRVQHLENDIRNGLQIIETSVSDGFKGVHQRQDTTNGRVRWLEKMIYLAIGGLGVLSIIVLPLLWALIQAGRI